MAKVLVTGATGIVGSEIVTELQRRRHQVTAISARGSVDGSVLAWRMGFEPCPQSIPAPDIVIHAAADTRWNLSTADALRANLSSLEGLTSIMPGTTRIVLLSTSYAIGYGRAEPTSVDSFRNTYEWSKAAAERFLNETLADAGTIRFPIVIGRRSDGYISRLAGLMRLFKPLVAGLVPAIVGRADALLDLAPVDEVATNVVDIATSESPLEKLTVIGYGADAPSVRGVFQLIFDTLDVWRSEHGVPSVVRPPIIPPERWDRFFLNFAREHLTLVQMQLVDMLNQYRPYLCLPDPFKVDIQLVDAPGALQESVYWWAKTRPREANAIAQPW
jgi:nucleoside-diphosphate-sugar epimerase